MKFVSWNSRLQIQCTNMCSMITGPIFSINAFIVIWFLKSHIYCNVILIENMQREHLVLTVGSC